MRDKKQDRSHPIRTKILLLWCGGLIVSACLYPGSAAADVRAGVARETFTLPQRVPLAGYGRRGGKPSRGVHDPVGVRALVLQDDHATAALVSCDLLIVDEQLFDAVHRRLIESGFPRDLVLILAGTHTHSGPGAYGRRFVEKISMGHFNPQVFEALVAAITQAVRRARDNVAPTRIAYGVAQTEGLVVNRMDPHGPTDPEVIVSGFYRERVETPFAVIVNFAAHPTTLGAWNRELSADYPGVVMRELERRVPGAVCLFVAGSVGDQAPVKSGSGFEAPEHLGTQLAQQAVIALERARPEPGETLHALQERMALPPAELRLGRLTLPRWMGARLVDDDATLSVVVAGRTAFIGVPCDLSAALGAALKGAARARDLEPVIVGFASDYIGYCVPAALYEAHKYESSMAFNGPKTGELIVEHLTHMLEQITTGGR